MPYANSSAAPWLIDDVDEYTGHGVFWIPPTARWGYLAEHAKGLPAEFGRAPKTVGELIAYFLALKGVTDSTEFRRRFDLMALQRNLKALGTFGFQTTTKGNPVYIQYIPRTLAVARANLERYPRFARLRPRTPSTPFALATGNSLNVPMRPSSSTTSPGRAIRSSATRGTASSRSPAPSASPASRPVSAPVTTRGTKRPPTPPPP